MSNHCDMHGIYLYCDSGCDSHWYFPTPPLPRHLMIWFIILKQKCHLRSTPYLAQIKNTHGTSPCCESCAALWSWNVIFTNIFCWKHGTNYSRIHVKSMVCIWRIFCPFQKCSFKLYADFSARISWQFECQFKLVGTLPVSSRDIVFIDWKCKHCVLQNYSVVLKINSLNCLPCRLQGSFVNSQILHFTHFWVIIDYVVPKSREIMHLAVPICLSHLSRLTLIGGI